MLSMKEQYFTDRTTRSYSTKQNARRALKTICEEIEYEGVVRYYLQYTIETGRWTPVVIIDKDWDLLILVRRGIPVIGA